ncbi:MAG TPA: dodecin [Candidatus Krumholzibacteria bacterium]|nr:dodecin [Candidatus Krumholzibacteria bacterium]
MSNHVYKQVEITGSSSKGIEDAIENAVNKTAKSVHNLRWFEVTRISGHIEGQKVAHYQVSMKIGFTLDD